MTNYCKTSNLLKRNFIRGNSQDKFLSTFKKVGYELAFVRFANCTLYTCNSSEEELQKQPPDVFYEKKLFLKLCVTLQKERHFCKDSFGILENLENSYV